MTGSNSFGSSSKQGKISGFTFLEVILVIMIASLIVLIILPIFTNFIPNIALESEARKLKADIRYVQQLAISSSMTHRIKFDIASDLYRIYSVDKANNETFVEKKEMENYINLVSTDFSNDKLDFTSLGEPSEGGTILLGNKKGQSATVAVTPSTGIVTITLIGL